MSTQAVNIPGVASSQLVGAASIPLKSGTLSLTPSPSSPTPDTKLLLSIDTTLALPLTSSTVVGTHTDRPRTYLFTLPLGDTTGFLEVTLPESADLPSTPDGGDSLALQFERLLVDYGFLKAGLVADADDMARAVKETAAVAAAGLVRHTDERIAARSPVEEDEVRHFSDKSRKAMGATVRGTGKVAETTAKVTDAVGDAAISAGEWTGQKISTIGGGGAAGTSEGGDAVEPKKEDSLPKEAVKQTLDAAGVAVEGIGESMGKVAGTVGESWSRIAEHERGPEAKEMVEQGREAAGNIGKAAVDLTTGTSVVWHAGEAGVGMAKGGTAEKVVADDSKGEEQPGGSEKTDE